MMSSVRNDVVMMENSDISSMNETSECLLHHLWMGDEITIISHIPFWNSSILMDFATY